MLNITKREFEEFSKYVRAHYGINFKKEKKALIEGRLNGVIAENNFESLSEYLEYVIGDKTGHAASIMLNKITTNHTYFMREPEHFHFFKNEVLPYLERTVTNKDLRIWSAACSSGEEPYTLAMIIDEYFGHSKHLWDTKILATDISSQVLAKATSGIYSKESTDPLSKNWKLAYFSNHDNDNLIINQKIRNEVIFRKFNLVGGRFPFRKKLHVVFCRNVMIYFNEQTKIELINKIYDTMEDGGYLFIGHSEALTRGSTKFKYVMPSVYRKE